jgi:hypothetical protein
LLLDNKKKVVETFIENLLAGTVTGDLIHILTSPVGKDLDPDQFDQLIDNIIKWYSLRNSPDSADFIHITNHLFTVLLRGRIVGSIKGVFKEIPELENALHECKEDNRSLAFTLKEQSRIIATYEAGMDKQK